MAGIQPATNEGSTSGNPCASSIIHSRPEPSTTHQDQDAAIEDPSRAASGERTPLNTGKQNHCTSLSVPGGHRQLRRFWVPLDESDDEADIATPTTEELISAASREGFTIEELVTAHAELEAAEKVSFPSPSSSNFRCPLANKIVKALTRDRSLKHQMKPWSGPLPKPRISPPKTLGDAVIKNSRIRLRGGRTVPMLFKMSIPSTTNASISSSSPTQTNHQDVTLLEWPSLPNIRLPHKTPMSEAISSQDSSTVQSKAAELQNSNSELGKANQEPNMTRPANRILIHEPNRTRPVNRILIQNGPARA
jgi:hypothetical protein